MKIIAAAALAAFALAGVGAPVAQAAPKPPTCQVIPGPYCQPGESGHEVREVGDGGPFLKPNPFERTNKLWKTPGRGGKQSVGDGKKPAISFK